MYQPTLPVSACIAGNEWGQGFFDTCTNIKNMYSKIVIGTIFCLGPSYTSCFCDRVLKNSGAKGLFFIYPNIEVPHPVLVFNPLMILSQMCFDIASQCWYSNLKSDWPMIKRCPFAKYLGTLIL